MSKRFIEISPGYGYSTNIDDAHETIREYQKKTYSRFAVIRTEKGFGKIDASTKRRKLLWCDTGTTNGAQSHNHFLPFDGIPFFILGRKILVCRVESSRSERKRKIDESGSTVCSTTCNCSARISVFEVLKYPAYLIHDNSDISKQTMSQKLYCDIKETKAVAERRFYIFFPKLSDHQNHLVLVNGKWVKPQSVQSDSDYKEEEEDLSNASIMQTVASNVTVGSSECCCELLEEIKNKTYTCDENTLAHTHIMLKNVLDRFNEVTQKQLGQAVAQNSETIKNEYIFTISNQLDIET